MLLLNAGIASRPITSRNPQSNGIVEQVHKTVAQVLRSYCTLKPPTTTEQAHQYMQSAISAAMHATRCASHSSLDNASPGALAFGRDMWFEHPFSR